MKGSKHYLRAMATAAVLMVAAQSASAQISGISFIATTQFQFDGVGGYSSLATLGGMTVHGGSFNVTTDNFGFASIGGVGQNFGLMDVTADDATYSGHTLQMQVTFTSPTGALVQTWNSLLNGTVSAGTGGVGNTWFNSNPNPDFYITGTGTGLFSVSANGVNVTAPNTGQQISGSITAFGYQDTNSTPEPASLVLLGTGLVGVIGVARRRNRA